MPNLFETYRTAPSILLCADLFLFLYPQWQRSKFVDYKSKTISNIVSHIPDLLKLNAKE